MQPARHSLPFRRALFFAVLFFCALTVAHPVPAWAQGLLLHNFVLDNQAGDMTLRFSLGIDKLGTVRAMLREGYVLELQCEAELHRKRSYWLDEPLAEGDLQNLLKADPEREHFVLEQPGNVVVRARALQELLDEAWRSLSIDLGAFSLLQRGEAYTVELNVRLVQYEVPAWKRWTMFFRDFEVVEGARYQMDFEY